MIEQTRATAPTSNLRTQFNQAGGMSVAIFAAGLLMGVLLSVFLMNGAGTNSATRTTAEARGETVAQPTAPADIATIPPVAQSKTLEGAREFLTIGEATAPVKLVIFSDPRCIYCRALSQGAEQDFLDNYVKAGKAVLVYRHFPVLGAASMLISKGLECAGQQGQFKAYHALVYGAADSPSADEAQLAKWAADLKLDANQFQTCLKDAKTSLVIQADMDVGVSLGVRGTPSMFIAGKPLLGDVPYSLLQSTVEEALREVQ
jgi:protein-disulfide isomerase